MGYQMYFVVQNCPYSDDSSRQIQSLVHACGGLILMVTKNGPIVALEDGGSDAVARHPLVKFVGPVTLSPRGYAAERLQHIFAQNLQRQLQPNGHGGAEAAP